MYRKTQIALLVVILIFTAGLYAEKDKERLANEKGVEGENFWEEEKFFESATAMEEAVRLYQEAVAEKDIPIDEAKIDRWHNLAFSAYYKAKDYENALRVQNIRIERHPDDNDLYANKAILLKSLSRNDEAIQVYTYMDSQKPSYKTREKIAKIYEKAEDWDNALIWYRKSYELRQSSNTIKNIAVINLKLGRNDKAIEAYEDFLSTDPSVPNQIKTYRYLGKLYEDLGDNTNSTKNYEKTLSLKYDPQIAMLLISKYYDLKQYTKGLAKIEEYLKEKPGNNYAIYYRALIKYDQGDLLGARQDFESVLDDPQYAASAKGYIDSINSQ